MKTESKIPTAKDLIAPIGGLGLIQQAALEILMHEYAKLHVEAALKAALISALQTQDKYGYIDEKSILNAYPTDNIK